MSLLARRAPPSAAHLLGTDALGHDMLARVIFGARSSLAVGLLAPLAATLVGGALGLLAGYFRGWLETITVGASDVLLAFPPLVLALAVTAYLGQSVPNLILVLAILTIPAVTRIARAGTLALRGRDFVTAARALGASHTRIMLREILPNIALPLAAYFLLLVAVIVTAESILSFLGLGVPPPLPSWGSMIAEGRENLELAPHIAFIPAAVMFLTVLAFNLVGDRLRSLTDPRRAGA
jgi:peptide/nickel transport system permease protein